MRSTRRMQSRYFGKKSKVGDADLMEHEVECEEGAEVGVIDRTPTEVTSEHIELRESLVKQFQVRYGKNLVHWLHYPKRANVCK